VDVARDADLNEFRREEWRLSPTDLKPDVYGAETGKGPHLRMGTANSADRGS
jgi:hypothetical protein